VAPSPDRETATLFDRVALAFLSGLSALLLAALLWGGIALFAAQVGFDGLPPFWPVAAFATAMALVGFVALENFVGDLIGSLVRPVLRWLGWLAP
jgi:TRAP-type C4-dicarboxylate transport system permease small subunit